MRKVLALTAAFVLFTFSVFGQSPRVVQLGEVLSNGTVTLSATGNGVSSGFAVEGYLKNNTRNAISINVIIENGIYLKNSGHGQNMVAIQVFLSDGGYYSEGRSNYIMVPAQTNVAIVFDAFCANFELDNPSRDETFSVTSIPASIRGITSNISKYAANTFDSDNDATTAIQLALWRSQGLTRDEITRKFEFDFEEWELSTAIMNIW